MTEFKDKEMRWQLPRDRWGTRWGRRARKDVSRDGITHNGAFGKEKADVKERCEHGS